MLLNNKDLLAGDATVAIIGAGPVGLTIARLLQQKGVRVTVYERDKDPRTRISGGTLDLHRGSGQDALKAAGLLNRYYSLAKPMGRIVTDTQGNVLVVKPCAPEEQYDNPEINRNDLRSLLLDSLSSNTVAWDRKFTSLEEHAGKWLLHFENGMSATADMVIGANGGMTKVRRYVTDAEVEYTGTFMIQGEVTQGEIKCPAFYQLCDNNILMASGNGNLLVANPKNNSVLSYNVIFEMPEQWIRGNGLDFQNANSVSSFLLNRFADWNKSYHQLFRATSFYIGLQTRKISLEKSWTTNRPLPITLIGDAAHLMPPFAGQGVNIGLMDALILSDNLTNGKFETAVEAVYDYEQQMRVYAMEAQLQTARNELVMHQPDFSLLKFYH